MALFVAFEFLETCKPLFNDLGFLFFDFETWEGFGSLEMHGFGDKNKKSLVCEGFGTSKFWKCRFWKLNFQAVIKSAASAASPKTQI